MRIDFSILIFFMPKSNIAPTKNKSNIYSEKIIGAILQNQNRKTKIKIKKSSVVYYLSNVFSKIKNVGSILPIEHTFRTYVRVSRETSKSKIKIKN